MNGLLTSIQEIKTEIALYLFIIKPLKLYIYIINNIIDILFRLKNEE